MTDQGGAHTQHVQNTHTLAVVTGLRQCQSCQLCLDFDLTETTDVNTSLIRQQPQQEQQQQRFTLNSLIVPMAMMSEVSLDRLSAAILRSSSFSLRM